MSEITVVELKALCEEILKQREITDKAEEEYKAQNKICDELENKLVGLMTDLNMKDFREAGSLFLLKKTSSVSTPKDENKEVFFNYLKEIGHFDALATVHSRTLNSWYNQELDAAHTRGEAVLMIPGLEMPVERIGLTIRKSK